MKDFFKELFEYNHHMNQQLIDSLLQSPQNISEKSLKLMSHILNAQNIWNSRIENITPLYGIWQEHEPVSWTAIDQNNTTKTIVILENADLQKNIAYKTSQGQPFENSVRDILFHAINHSTHHRGQIASDMKQHGVQPIISDYIFYKR